MSRECIITQREIEAEKLAFVQADLSGRKIMDAKHYVMRRLRECGLSLTDTKCRKMCDKHGVLTACPYGMQGRNQVCQEGKCVWIFSAQTI